MQEQTGADAECQPELPRLAVRRHRRPDQALRLPLHHAQSGRELPRPARLAGQLRRQRAADDALPARGDRGADRARLRQGDRQADGGDPARSRRPAARLPWRSTTPISTACRSSSSARPVRWTRASAGRTSTGRTRRCVQGNAVRDYVKWDYQPTSIEGVPESFARAYSIMTTEPQGPVYMCYDAALQEEPLDQCRSAAARRCRGDAGADGRRTRGAIAAIADKLLAAEHPMLLAEYAGRRAGGFESIVALAETERGGGVGRQQRAQLSQQASALPEHGQAVAPPHRPRRRARRADWEKQLTELDSAARTREQVTPPRCDFVEIGFGEINICKWSMDYCRMQPCSVRALGDTALGIPELTRICKERIAGDAGARIAHRRAQAGDRQAPRRRSGRNGRKRRARAGTPRRSPSRASRWRSGR